MDMPLKTQPRRGRSLPNLVFCMKFYAACFSMSERHCFISFDHFPSFYNGRTCPESFIVSWTQRSL